jgi:GTP diphosphokinase / guanosine-3',5'-bis(diphosphate) 3'-diphosphatase
LVASMRSAKGAIRHRLMQTIDQLKAADRTLIEKAVQFAEEAHEGQFRMSTRQGGRPDPYIVHPMKVALIFLEELGLKDPDALAVAILHDVMESTQRVITASDLEEHFGRSIALAVSILTKPKPDASIPREVQLSTFYGRLRQSHIMTRLICLSDRLDNMRDAIDLFDSDMQARLLEETIRIHIPLAEETDDYLNGELLTICSQLPSESART